MFFFFLILSVRDGAEPTDDAADVGLGPAGLRGMLRSDALVSHRGAHGGAKGFYGGGKGQVTTTFMDP